MAALGREVEREAYPFMGIIAAYVDDATQLSSESGAAALEMLARILADAARLLHFEEGKT